MNRLQIAMIWTLSIVISISMVHAETTASVVRCPYPYQQIYSDRAGKCLSLVDGPCEPARNNGSATNSTFEKLGSKIKTNQNEIEAYSWLDGCVSGAVCFKEELFGYCVCEPSLVSSPDRKCVLNYGALCNHSSEGLKCDHNRLLSCIDGQCKCKNNMHEFDSKLSECVGKVGAFCKARQGRKIYTEVPDVNPEENIKCTSGAFCYIAKQEKYGNGVCRCDERFTSETVNRTCEHRRYSCPSNTPNEMDGASSGVWIFFLICMAFMSFVALAIDYCCCCRFGMNS